jgi:hypothetical protein
MQRKKLFLLIDIVYAIDGEDASDEESNPDMIFENESSRKNGKNKLDVRGESDKKWTRNLHEFLEKKVKHNSSDDTGKRNTEHAKSRQMFEWICTRDILV